MTKRLYREGGPLLSPGDAGFWGRIVALERTEDERLEIELDQTLFYPTSGGQPCDTGTLNGLAVQDVIERGEETIIHVLEAAEETQKWAPGRELEGKVDVARRRDHMEQHSGQHLLSAVLLRHGVETVSFHLGAEVSSVDLATEALAPELVATIEAEVNAEIRACHPVKATVHRGSAVTPIAERLRKPPTPEALASPHGLRIVQIGPDETPIDRDPCCGTHVESTGQLGSVVLLGTERGRKGETRLSFVVGERAQRAWRERLDVLARAGQTLTVGHAELPERAGKLLAQVKDLSRELKKAQGRLVELEAAAFARRAGKHRALSKLLEGGDAKDAGAFARACVAARPDAVVGVVHAGERLTLVIARGEQGPELDAKACLQELLEPLEGKGGGSPAFAQGAAPDPAKAGDLLTAAGQALTAAAKGAS